MVRIISAAIAGFVVWTIMLFATDWIFEVLSPDWYARNQAELQTAMNNKMPYIANTGILLVTGVRSAIFSFIAGYVTAAIAGENSKSTLLLGVILLAFGIFVHTIFWNYVPFWYHILIFVPIIPMTLLGGKLKKM